MVVRRVASRLRLGLDHLLVCELAGDRHVGLPAPVIVRVRDRSPEVSCVTRRQSRPRGSLASGLPRSLLRGLFLAAPQDEQMMIQAGIEPFRHELPVGQRIEADL